MRVKAWFALKLGLLCVLALLCTTLQAQETTGGIQGTVKDPTGAVIPSAVVEISSPALIGKKTSVSDAGGYFHFEQLPPGPYTVVVTAPGFAAQTLSNLDVKTGGLPTVNVALQVGGVQQEVTVEVSSAPEIIDVTLSKVQTVIPQEVLTAIPKSRSFQSLIPFAPGARQEPLTSARENRSNGFQIDGATDSENVYMIDGVNTTSLLGGGVGKDFQPDFIQEVQVKSSGFEAEFGGALGGVINAVAKRGSNTWHGELKGYFQSAALNAIDPCAAGFTSTHLPAYWAFLNNNIPSGYTGLECGLRLNPATALNTTTRQDGTAEFFIPKRDSRHVIEPGYEIGGPLFTDRLWFFSSYIPTLDSIARTVDFRCPAANPSCSFAGPRRMTQNFTQHNAFNRLDYRVSDKLRLFGSWNYAYSRLSGALPAPDSAIGQVNTGATIDPTTLRPDSGAVNPFALYSFSGDWVPSSKILVNARYGYFFTNFSSRGVPTLTRYVYDQNLNAATRDINNNPFPANAPFNPSGFSNVPNNFRTIYDSFKRKTFNTDFSYFVGNVWGAHNLKLGYTHQAQINDVLITANAPVVYLFWGIRYSPVTSSAACSAIQASNPAGLCQGQYGYFHVGSTSVSNSGSADATSQAFYLQDSWIVKNTGLTLNLGVRFDQETNPSYNPNTFPPIEFGWSDKIAPRLGAAYDVLHNGKVKLYASYGKFFDLMKLNLTRSKSSNYWHECVYALDTIDLSSITPTGSGAGCPPSGPAPGVNARFIENVNLRALNNDARDPAFQPGMKPISSHDFTTGLDWAMTPNLVLETRYTRKRLDQTIEDMAITDNLGFYNGNPGTNYADILHRPVIIPDANGVLYLNTTPFCDECPHALKPERRYDAMELRLTHRGGARWFGTASYTYSKLRGNYSGLVDSDPTDANGGRHSPNTGRAFDLPTMTYMANGKPDDGPLSTDRPHTGKIFGYYRLPWLGQETSFGLSQALYQGTPISTCIGTVSSSIPASSCQVAEGRGNFVQVHRDPSGSIVKDGVLQDYRTPAYLQTDVSIRHEIRVSKDREDYRLVFEGNAYNLFNQHAATSFYQYLVAANSVSPSRPSRFSGDPRFDWGKILNGYNYIEAVNATGAFAGVQTPLTLAARYGQPRTFQIARQFRFAVRFMF